MKNMKKLAILCTIALSSVCLFQSCSDDDDDVAMTNQEFVTQASSSNSFEVILASWLQPSVRTRWLSPLAGTW